MDVKQRHRGCMVDNVEDSTALGTSCRRLNALDGWLLKNQVIRKHSVNSKVRNAYY